MASCHLASQSSDWVIVVALTRFGKHLLPEPSNLEFTPDHFVDDARVGLDNLHYFGGYVFIHVIRNGDAVMTVTVERYGSIHGL